MRKVKMPLHKPGRDLDVLVAIQFYGLTPYDVAPGIWRVGTADKLAHYSTDTEAAWKLWNDIIRSSQWCCCEMITDYDYCYRITLKPGYGLKGHDEHKAAVNLESDDLCTTVCNAALRAAEYAHNNKEKL